MTTKHEQQNGPTGSVRLGDERPYLLLEAKAALPRAQFTKMEKTDLPSDKRAAQMLMAVQAAP